MMKLVPTAGCSSVRPTTASTTAPGSRKPHKTCWSLPSSLSESKYPASLEALVADGYLRGVPKDPITNSSDSWQSIPSEPDASNPEAEIGIFDVKSGSDGTSIDVAKECAKVQYETNQANIWGANNPVWQVYAYGPVSDLLPNGVSSPVFVLVLVGDDPSESDSNPQVDVNGVLTLHLPKAASAKTRKIAVKAT